VKALTIKQPWADAICFLGKRVENRSWRPPAELVGQRIAIHAAKAFDTRGHDRFYATDLVGPTGVVSFAQWLMMSNPRVRGAIVATAVLVRVVEQGDSPWFSGPVGWVLDELRVLLEPLECRGAQRLWTVPIAIEEALRTARTWNGDRLAI
jgi:hypothetical protein